MERVMVHASLGIFSYTVVSDLGMHIKLTSSFLNANKTNILRYIDFLWTNDVTLAKIIITAHCLAHKAICTNTLTNIKRKGKHKTI